MDPSVWLVLLIITSLAFDFLNGFNDSADLTATIISSRSMSARMALTMVAVAGFAGPFLFGYAVAKTIAGNIVAAPFISIQVLVAALISALAWSLVTWWRGIPSSSSHALIGGLIGAAFISNGVNALILPGILKIFISLIVSPVAGLMCGWLLMRVILYLVRNATPGANAFFKTGQIPTALALALGNGANDTQKTIGIITLALMITGHQDTFSVLLWVAMACAGIKCLGTLIGGWRIMHTLGTKLYKIKPIHSFTSQLASSMVIVISSLMGGPVSTTQVVSMSIIGAGAGERLSKVRWSVLKNIFSSWMLTIPFTALLSMLIYVGCRFIWK